MLLMRVAKMRVGPTDQHAAILMTNPIGNSHEIDSTHDTYAYEVVTQMVKPEMLNFGAFIAFMGVNAAAFVHYFLRSPQKRFGNFFMPVVGFVVCAFIWWSLSPPAKIAGTIWVAIGIAYGAWKTSGFRKEMSFEVPPES